MRILRYGRATTGKTTGWQLVQMDYPSLEARIERGIRERQRQHGDEVKARLTACAEDPRRILRLEAYPGTLVTELQDDGLGLTILGQTGAAGATLSFDLAKRLRERLRVMRLADVQTYDAVGTYDSRNRDRTLTVYVHSYAVQVGWEDSKRLVAFLDSLDLTPRRRSPLVLAQDVRDAARGDTPVDPRVEQEDPGSIDEGTKAKIYGAGPRWKAEAQAAAKPKRRTKRDRQADPKERKPVKATTKKKGGGGMAKDTSVRSGGKLLGGVRLKNGTTLANRKTGRTVTFKGFDSDDRAKLVKADGTKTTVSRASLAAAYVPQ